MQYYTKQQVQGSGRYQPRVLVGNWNEDRSLEETILKDFIAKKDTGNLKIDGFQARMSTALAPVDMTVVQNDGFVHFGDIIQVAHCDTGAVLAADIEDKDRRTGEHACAATAAPQTTDPCARNTFLLAKYDPPRLDVTTTRYADNVLRYGQKVRLIANPQVRGESLEASGGRSPLYLFSKPVSTTHFAKYSHHQLAGFTSKAEWDTVFCFVTPDPAKRIASEGVEVMAGVPVCLLHCATGALFCLENDRYPNDFGMEREVSFNITKSNAKKAMLTHEARGELTATISKALEQPNHFRIITGTTEATIPSARDGTESVGALLAELSHALAASAIGFDGFQKKLLLMDCDGSGKVPLDELVLACSYAGVDLPPAAAAQLGRTFRHDQDGTVDARALLADIEMAASHASR